MRRKTRTKSKTYWLAIFLLVGGALYAGSRAPAPKPPSQQEQQEEEARDDDFIPTQDLPAGSSISFPVDI